MSNTGSFRYWQRTMLHAGPGTVIRLPGLFSAQGARRVMLLSDAGLKDVGLVDKITEIFDQDNVPGGVKLAGVFTGLAADAESGSINEALKATRECAADSLLALGGGSVQDSVKMIKLAMYQKSSSIDELLRSPILIRRWPEVEYMGVPHISVPTTAGTGAELTQGGVILNKARGLKHLIVSDYLEADIAVLDAHMTTGLPPMLTAATGMDALTHAIETMAHININTFALAHAITAGKTVWENLPKVVKNGRDLMARQNMLNGSAMACNAVQSDLGAAPVHHFAQPYGALFHIHHGEANGVFLPLILEALVDYYVPTADRFKDVFGLAETDPRAIILAAAAMIRTMTKDIGHPQDFARHNIPESALPDIIKAISHDALAGFLPIDPATIESISSKACAW